jgi:hypothetical protein
MNKRKTPLNKLYDLEDSTIKVVNAYLFDGSVLGGRSLVSLLEDYRKNGIYHPIRRNLIKHLFRCAEALVDAEATVIARCHVNPNRRVKR